MSKHMASLKSAREIRQKKIDAYYAKEQPIHNEDNAAAVGFPVPEKAFSNDKDDGKAEQRMPESTPFIDEKKDDELNKASQTFETIDLASASSSPRRDNTDDHDYRGDDSDKEDQEMVYEGATGIEKNPSMTETPLCGACGCF